MRRLHALLLFISGTAFAQIGEPPPRLLQQLGSLKPTETAQGYRAQGVTFTLIERGDALYSVSGTLTLNPQSRQALAQLVGAATGYGAGIAQPLSEFLGARAAEIAGRGKITLAVEEFVLRLELTGEAAPHRARFALELLEVTDFPPAAHTLGPKDAKVVIREFSDFQCPYCAQFASGILPQLKETLLGRGNVRFEFHHLPLVSIHANAQLAAEAAECVTEANTPKDFWTFHDALFTRLQAWAALGDAQPYFVRLARELGLSDEGVAACLREGHYTGEVQEAYRVATERLGLNSTPSVFVGGYRLSGSKVGVLEGYEEMIARLEAFANP